MSEYDVKYDIKRKIDEATAELRKDIARLERARLADGKLLAEAFNKMTQAIGSIAGEVRVLAGEVRALRADLSPQKLDKPKLSGRRFTDDGTG